MDNTVYLTVKEVAELKQCSERYIRMVIEAGKMDAEAVKLDIQGPGRGGVQYRIPLTTLDDRLKIKFKRLLKKREKTAMREPEPIPPHQPEDMTGAEREQIAFWKELLAEWRQYRYSNNAIGKEDADEKFIAKRNRKDPALKLNRRTLYRKWNALNEKGETALLDRRGKHGNHTKKLTSEIWDIFEAFYLDESQKSVTLCIAAAHGRGHVWPLPGRSLRGVAYRKACRNRGAA